MGMDSGEFVVFFMTILLVISYAWGVQIQDTFFIRGASAFFSIPLNAMAPFAEWGLVFAAAVVLVFSKYSAFLEGFLGENVYSLAFVAAIIAILTGVWTP